MVLSVCDSIYGGSTIIKGSPRYDTFEDVLYVPESYKSHKPGCYDRGRKLITASGSFSGIPDINLLFGEYFTTLEPTDYSYVSAPGEYIFLGPINLHYGHFLLSILSRLWWLVGKTVHADLKLLYCNSRTPQEIFAVPFIRDIFNVLGLKESNLLKFDTPMRLEKVIIPAPSFEENNIAYEAFAKFCNWIGDKVENHYPARQSSTPAYFAKTKIEKGVSRLFNEDILCERLEKYGIDIIIPEELSLFQQIMIFRERPLVMGTTGSALHTGIFTPRNRLIGLSYGEEMWSNQILLDGINNNDSLYVYPKDDILRIGKYERFQNNFVLADPIRTADELVRKTESFLSQQDLPSLPSIDPAILNMDTGISDSLPGTIISNGKPTTQSSICPWSRESSIALDSAGAVSGVLTGSYQFHTDIEEGAWWQVDLEKVFDVTGVRLFNRFDGLEDRSAHLKLMGSQDGQNWTVLNIRDEDTPFGGVIGHPYEWRPTSPVRLRFFRIQLLGRNYLHLDQVQIFGHSDNPS